MQALQSHSETDLQRRIHAVCSKHDGDPPRRIDFDSLPGRIDAGVSPARIQWDVVAVWLLAGLAFGCLILGFRDLCEIAWKLIAGGL